MPVDASLPPSLSRVHAWARAQPWLARFTLMNRLLLAMAFLPTGLVKATGQRFTLMPVETPVGFFFEAMYRTGPFWYFIGFAQICAAVLLLIPATATIGALLFLPIILSIVLITWGVGFGNTVIVVGAMLLADVYLLCWDADRLWCAGAPLVGARRGARLLEGATLIERLGWGLGGLVGIALFLETRSFLPPSSIRGLLIAGAAAAAMVVTGWVIGLSRSRRPHA